MTKTKKLLVVLAALAAIATTVAAAGTTTNNTAAACVAVGGGEVAITAEGRAENPGATGIQVVCPIERPSGHSKVSATVWALDRNTSTNVCCRAVSRNPSGTVVQSTATCSSGSSTAAQTMTTGEITDSATYSSFFVLCDVPAAQTNRSGIVLYRSNTQ